MAASQRQDSNGSTLICHLSFWFGIFFATPLFIAINNTGELSVGLGGFALTSAVAAGLLTLVTFAAARAAGHSTRWWSNRVFLTLALVAAIQGNFIHNLFEYGTFNGATMNLRDYGWKFWLEWYGWLLAFPLIFLLLTRVRSIPGWLAALPLLSFALLLLPAIFATAGSRAVNSESGDIDPSIFAFSSQKNLVHLLPDGLQGDVVREVFEQNPEIAEAFRGFTLYTNHVGQYQGTAPSVYTILTGEPFDFSRGFDYQDITPVFKNESYPAKLAEQNFQVDYVPISPVVCIEDANSCITRSFGDMKARALQRRQHEDLSYSLRLIADLTLFRLSPLLLKERIYDEGYWFLADTTLDGSSPWPDPVIREWTDNLHLVHDRPVYKWHHYLGTHIPAKWNGECEIQRDLEHTRENYRAQAECVLKGIAALLRRLEEAGVYDRTAMIISGDHGHNIRPDDVVSDAFNSALYKGLHGSARPAFLVKELNNNEPIRFSTEPTTLLDITPMALALAGVGEENLTMDEEQDAAEQRRFTRYSSSEFYSGDPIPNVVFTVDGAANDPGSWRVTGINQFQESPQRYDPVNYRNAFPFMQGASLDRNEPDADGAWVSGRQLAFLLDVAEPGTNHELRLSLHVPEYARPQSITVSVNHEELDSVPVPFEDPPFWQEVEITIDKQALRQGTNFFSLVFGQAGRSSEEDEWRVAGKIRSIHLETTQD